MALVEKYSGKAKDDSGSLSVLVIGLFVITVAFLMVMTDVGIIMVAKRSLAQATEAAAQRGVHTLDSSAYYQGKGSMFTVPLGIATQREHSVIPIDCDRGGFEALLELNSWNSDQSNMRQRHLKGIQLTGFECDGENLEIQTQSQIGLPFKVPFSSTTSVTVQAFAGVSNQVREGFYLFGYRIR